MFRCPSDILITSWLFTARWSTWPRNHLVPCVAELIIIIISAFLMRRINRCCSANNGSLHQMLNRCLFSALPKALLSVRRETGRAFHVAGPQQWNPRRPMLVFVLGTNSWPAAVGRILHPNSCTSVSSWSKVLFFIHCASLSTTFALSQSMTWFSSTAWSVMVTCWSTWTT